MTLYRGDNLQAFNGDPIKIDVTTSDGSSLPVINKAVFVINNGVIVKEFNNPEFPVYVSLDEAETAKLSFKNTGRLILYDVQDRKLTLDNILEFTSSPEVYHGS